MSDAYLVVSSARLRVRRTPFSQVARESDAQHIGPLDHRTGKTMHLWYIARRANTKRGCGTVICPCPTSLAEARSKTTRHLRYLINILSHIQRLSSTAELVLSVLDPGAAVISSMLSFVPNNPGLVRGQAVVSPRFDRNAFPSHSESIILLTKLIMFAI